MALPQIVSRNQVQKIPTFEINGRVVLQPNTWYTCPTGRKAIVKGSVTCTSRGAAADVDFVAAGVVMFSWVKDAITDTFAKGPAYIDQPENMATANGGQRAFFEVELAAGETIVTQQDSGTNAEFNVFASVQETPV